MSRVENLKGGKYVFDLYCYLDVLVDLADKLLINKNNINHQDEIVVVTYDETRVDNTKT